MRIDRELFSGLSSLRLAAQGAATGNRQGDRRSPFRGRGMEFADYRPYAPGDDLRLVDWNVYARLRTVLVRLYHEDRNLSVRVCVDVSASMAHGTPRKADHAAELAAGLALVALLVGDRVEVGCVGGGASVRSVVGHDARAFAGVLRLLEEVEPGGGGDPCRAVQAARRTDRLLYLSDLLHDDPEPVLRAVAASSARPVLLHVLSSDELAPDLGHAQRVVDVETGETLRIDGGLEAEHRYREALDAWLSTVRRRCRALGIQYVPAFTTVPTRVLLHRELRRHRVLESARGGAC